MGCLTHNKSVEPAADAASDPQTHCAVLRSAHLVRYVAVSELGGDEEALVSSTLAATIVDTDPAF